MQTSQLHDALNDLGEREVTEQQIYRMIADQDPSNLGIIKFGNFRLIVQQIREQRGEGSNEDDLMDAYVAMGGDSDGGGCVDAEKLIKTIRDDFEMTIDIEALIAEADEDGSGEIEFDEFRDMLAGRNTNLNTLESEENNSD